VFVYTLIILSIVDVVHILGLAGYLLMSLYCGVAAVHLTM